MRVSENQKSVVLDGLLLVAVLTLLALLLNLLIAPLGSLFGRAGLLIYTLVMIAVCAYCLDRALVPGFYETTRAWYGAVSGVIAWVVVALTDKLGVDALTQLSAVVWLILFGLVTAILWRRVLPIGARYFFMTFLMSWVARFLMVAKESLMNLNTDYVAYLNLSGYVAILGALIALIWMFLRSRQRTQKMWLGVWVWFFVIIALGVFVGHLI